MEDGGAVIGKLAYFHQGCVGQLFQNSGQISSETSVGGVAHHVDGFAVYFFLRGNPAERADPTFTSETTDWKAACSRKGLWERCYV